MKTLAISLAAALVLAVGLVGALCLRRAGPPVNELTHDDTTLPLRRALAQFGGPKCPATGSVPELMAAVNASLSKLSFTLHHAPGELDDRMQAVAERATVLLSCLVLLPSTHDESADASVQRAFRRHLAIAEDDVLALRTTALEHDEQGAKHWFAHVKQDCVSCHTACRAQIQASPATPSGH